MKVLTINQSDLEGGAAKAAFRLLEGVRREGIDANMLVQKKISDHFYVHGPENNIQKGVNSFRVSLDSVPKLFYPKRQNSMFSVQWLWSGIASKIKALNPDIIHLHWICRGFINISSLSGLGRPVVWTLHDMWPFTGGCHYAGDCTRYETQCFSCPQLGSQKKCDLSFRVHKQKQKHLAKLDMKVITPSRWLGRLAEKSRVFCNADIDIIPNGIDTFVYKPCDRQYARKLLGLPEHSDLILFGALDPASDERKGFHLLSMALEMLDSAALPRPLELVIFGSSRPLHPPRFNFKSHYMGMLKDDISLSLLYAACDLFTAPSIEDNLPNTIMESMACGTPCAAFNAGGIGDMISHKKNGILASPLDTRDLADGIYWILSDRERRKKLSLNAVEKVKKSYAIGKVAKQYLDVYNAALK